MGRLTCRRGSFVFLPLPRGGPLQSTDDCPWRLTASLRPICLQACWVAFILISGCPCSAEVRSGGV